MTHDLERPDDDGAQEQAETWRLDPSHAHPDSPHDLAGLEQALTLLVPVERCYVELATFRTERVDQLTPAQFAMLDRAVFNLAQLFASLLGM